MLCYVIRRVPVQFCVLHSVTTKAPFIATQLNSTQLNWTANDAPSAVLNKQRRWTRLQRHNATQLDVQLS